MHTAPRALSEVAPTVEDMAPPTPSDSSPLRTKKWGGHAAQKWSRAVRAKYGDRCWLQLEGCTGIATCADHIIPKSERPDLAYDINNGRPACRPCNSRRGTDFLAAAPTIDNRADFFSSNPTNTNYVRPVVTD